MGFQQYIAFTIVVPRILSMWPSQPSLCARMKFITCNLSGAQYFEMSPRFSEICISMQGHIN
jgi:hypothetical protein